MGVFIKPSIEYIILLYYRGIKAVSINGIIDRPHIMVGLPK